MTDTIVTPPRDHALLAELIQRQTEAGLSDSAFADKLGIIRQLWQLTRTGKRAIQTTLLRAILRTYPDLTDDVIAFLRDGDE